MRVRMCVWHRYLFRSPIPVGTLPRHNGPLQSPPCKKKAPEKKTERPRRKKTKGLRETNGRSYRQASASAAWCCSAATLPAPARPQGRASPLHTSHLAPPLPPPPRCGSAPGPPAEAALAFAPSRAPKPMPPGPQSVRGGGGGSGVADCYQLVISHSCLGQFRKKKLRSMLGLSVSARQ